MEVIVVGAGRLAAELIAHLPDLSGHKIYSWEKRPDKLTQGIVLHAGSGRELPEVLQYCEANSLPLLELATGSIVESTKTSIPVVLCPNTNILVLKFMHMLEGGRDLFGKYAISLTESHQAGKTSVPGTAVKMADALGLDAGIIESVRSPEIQVSRFCIPEAYLDRHAFHRIVIRDASCEISMDVKVLGGAPYVEGVSALINATLSRNLDNRLYTAMEFVKLGWI